MNVLEQVGGREKRTSLTWTPFELQMTETLSEQFLEPVDVLTVFDILTMTPFCGFRSSTLLMIIKIMLGTCKCIITKYYSHYLNKGRNILPMMLVTEIKTCPIAVHTS